MCRRVLLLASLTVAPLSGCDSNDTGPSQGEVTLLPDTVTHLSAEKFSSLQANTPALTVLDVRTAHEFSGGHIPGAKNIDIQQETFDEQASKLDPTQTYVVHCAAGSTGGRSERAARKLVALGLKHVYHLDGGYIAWEKLHTSKAK